MFLRRFKFKFVQLWAQVGILVLSGLGVAALGFLWYFLATSGPSPVDEVDKAPVLLSNDPKILRMIAEVDDLESKFNAFASAGTYTDEAIDFLDKAIDKQRQLLLYQLKPDYVQQEKLVRMQRIQDTAKATRTVGRVEQLTKDAEDAQAADRLADAEAKFKEALRLQRQINGGGADSKFKNYVRESTLEQSLGSLAAFPLHREKTAALKKADIAMSEQRWTDALTAYIAARDALERLNRDYGRTRYADPASMSRVQAEIESLNAAGMATKIDEMEKNGDDAEAAGDHEAATRSYSVALETQKAINTDFSRSRFVSSARVDSLDVKLQTARSQPLARELEKMEVAVREDLRLRRVVAAEQKLPSAGALTTRLATEYPRSRYVDGALRIRLSYLALKTSDLRKMQDEVYDHLLLMPGVSDRLMLGSEVPQGLYFMVMNTNPSRNPGRTMPVDSVNWNDANEFCTRLGWVLGTTVRLPTLDEYRVAVGSGGGDLRSSANGGRPGATDSGKPNEAGYRDLLGNLAEWLATDEASDKAVVAGGSYLDNPAELVALPTESRARVDRARHIGFRFVVVKSL
jgi:Sulfatase-modifying factor enzyme 1